MNRVASRLPETFETVRVKMGGKIAFVLEQQDLALESICSSDEFSAKDKLKATQDYLMLWIRLQNEVQKEQEFKENIKNKKLTNKIKQAEVADIEDENFVKGITPINQSKFSPTMQ